MTRDTAWQVVCEFVKSESLRRHMLGVEACLVAYAQKFDEDRERWAVTAPMKGELILAERGVDQDIRRAILSHANYSGVDRVSPLEKALFACDELSGFLTACSYVKPGKSIFEVDLPSVKRKLKDKAFARNVSRDDIINGALELNIPLDEHISFCLEAMKGRAGELGLAGESQAESQRA